MEEAGVWLSAGILLQACSPSVAVYWQVAADGSRYYRETVADRK